MIKNKVFVRVVFPLVPIRVSILLRFASDDSPFVLRSIFDRFSIPERRMNGGLTKDEREPNEERYGKYTVGISPKKSLKAHALKLFTNKFYKCVKNYFTFPTLIKYSAICTALRAAPLRIWSLTSQRVKPLGFAKSLRTRPT